MPDYLYYTGTYLGGSIPKADFPRLAMRAGEQLARYERIYTVTGNDNAKSMAVCAMADALYYYETAANTPQSSSIGSVSSSMGAADISSKAQSNELYRSACLYLDIFRGVS